jgi:putative acetyltransferase
MPKIAKVSIRKEQPGDFSAVGGVNRLAFGGEAEAVLVGKLRRSPGFIRALSLVAILEGRIIGHILFSPIQIRRAGGRARMIPALSLAPMAVRPGLQSRGIGSALVRRGLTRARRLGHKLVVVVGHPDYYPRFGFEPARARGLEAPFPVPDEAFMVLELSPGALRGVKGMVIYPPAFAEVS